MTSLHNVPVQGVCQRAKAAKRLPDAPEVSIVVATSLTSCKEDEEGGGGGGQQDEPTSKNNKWEILRCLPS